MPCTFGVSGELWQLDAYNAALYQALGDEGEIYACSSVNEIERSGFDPTVRDVFFSVGKDGTLWKSGAGTPNWMKLIEELPDGGWTGGV